MVKNLKEIYEKKILHYWCNCTGDLNIPGFPILACPEPEELPRQAREVYEAFWAEGRGAQEYVVTYDGTTGLMLGWLFDYGWLNDLGMVSGVEPNDLEREKLHDAVKAAAEKLANEHEFEVLYGEDTDPDGDEILMFIPITSLERDPKTRCWLDANGGKNIANTSDILYDFVEKKLKN